MTAPLDLAELRALAEAAIAEREDIHLTYENMSARHAFSRALHPGVALALLDRVAEAERATNQAVVEGDMARAERDRAEHRLLAAEAALEAVTNVAAQHRSAREILERERGEWKGAAQDELAASERWRSRAEAAERAVETAREALEHYAHGLDVDADAGLVARAALAAMGEKTS